jgi:hypothetical protein
METRNAVLTLGILSTLAGCMMTGEASPLDGRETATNLMRHAARALGVDHPAAMSFGDTTFAWAGDYSFEYHADRDILSFRMDRTKAYLSDAPPDEVRMVEKSIRGHNDPRIGGFFERGGGYFLLDVPRDWSYYVRDYPASVTTKSQFREGVEYHTGLGATWMMGWGARVAGIVHQLDDDSLPHEPLVWNDQVNALGAEVSRYTGRERANALVRAYARHRLVRGAKLDGEGKRDFGDFFFRYDADSQALTAAVFVATPTDLRTLAQQGVPEARLRAALADPAIGGRFDRPAGARFEWVEVRGAPMLYLAQSWPVAALTPRLLHREMETLLDFGVVWRHTRVFRVARIAAGKEAAPSRVVHRSPDEYGIAPARGGVIPAAGGK